MFGSVTRTKNKDKTVRIFHLDKKNKDKIILSKRVEKVAYSGTRLSYTNDVDRDWYGNNGLSVYVPKNVATQVSIGMDIFKRITAYQQGAEPFQSLKFLRTWSLHKNG